MRWKLVEELEAGRLLINRSRKVVERKEITGDVDLSR